MKDLFLVSHYFWYEGDNSLRGVFVSEKEARDFIKKEICTFKKDKWTSFSEDIEIGVLIEGWSSNLLNETVLLIKVKVPV